MYEHEHFNSSKDINFDSKNVNSTLNFEAASNGELLLLLFANILIFKGKSQLVDS